MYFPHSATMKRMVESGNQFIYQDNGFSRCFLQPIDEEESQRFGIAFSKGSTCFFPYGTDVQDGDRVTIDSVTYGVAGTLTRNYGSLKHVRAIMERQG